MMETDNALFALRREKLTALRAEGNAYPNDFKRKHLSGDLHAAYGTTDKETLAAKAVEVVVAGRLMLHRLMGKACFMTLQDMSGRIQVYLRQDELPEGVYEASKKWDLGDIVGVEGVLFRTKTDELSIHAKSIRLLVKSLQPLPEKFHGLNDQEMCYRQRYVDLMMNESTRHRFLARSKIVSAFRAWLAHENFIEVETPMMHPIAGGAAARPFMTHHNALDMQLFLRIAPELYLKRLVVGGFEKVFEMNRNFRNEGLSTRHNPEFTMLELYQAYADVDDCMQLTETLLRDVTQSVLGSMVFEYQGQEYDFSKPFERLTVVEAILKYDAQLSRADLVDLESVTAVAKMKNIAIHEHDNMGKILMALFEHIAEPHLIAPTFVTCYPIDVSPLSRRDDQDPTLAERFELFVGGREIANGFSELNDPEDQASRFTAQMEEKAQGDAEAMPYDADYVTALEYGMPPTAGLGIGIDRVVMLLTNAPSIRDVILFPHLRAQG